MLFEGVAVGNNCGLFSTYVGYCCVIDRVRNGRRRRANNCEGAVVEGADNGTVGNGTEVLHIFDAKAACDHLNGFNVMGRYLIVLYYQPNKVTKKMNLQKKEEELKELKR
ncbi:10863_t:CDS:2 [Entrophospora sp. SA101]|nr:10863_t:CDS:2 [Entrophospora sp. SA101]